MSKSSSPEVELYLRNLRQCGSVTSEGHFTVAGPRAIGKLATFLLCEESDWILKIVQAACAGKAPEIRINQTRLSTQIHFETSYSVDLSRFEKSLTSACESPRQPGLKDLELGLRAVGIGQLRDWVVKLSVAEEIALLSCVEGTVSAERLRCDSPLKSRTEITIGVAYPKGQSGKLGGIIRFGEAIQQEHMALLLKARACPVPLYLDGRRLDDLSESKMAAALETRAFLGVNAPSSASENAITIPRAIEVSKGKIQDRFCSHSPFSVSRFPRHRRATSLQRWYFNYRTTREPRTQGGFSCQPISAPSRVYLVRHGVVVGRTSIGVYHPISVDVFLNANDLRGDLTGLNVKATETEIEFAKDEIRDSRPFLRQVLDQLGQHTSRPLKDDLILYGGLGALGLMVPPLGIKAVVGAVSTVFLARSVKNHRLIVTNCVEQLRDFCQRTGPVDT